MNTYLILALGGVVIGVLVAAPIGPVNMICIRRTLAYGPLNGFFSGLGGAVGDGIFAAVTAFGLTAISQWIEGYAMPLKLVGGVVLIGFGIHNFRAIVTDPRDGCQDRTKELGSATLAGAIAGTFALTITNPATMIGFAALFAGLGALVAEEPRFTMTAVAVAGVVAGSAGWWFAITAVTGIFHRHVDAIWMRRINHLSGLVVGGLGVLVLGDLLLRLI